MSGFNILNQSQISRSCLKGALSWACMHVMHGGISSQERGAFVVVACARLTQLVPSCSAQTHAGFSFGELSSSGKPAGTTTTALPRGSCGAETIPHTTTTASCGCCYFLRTKNNNTRAHVRDGEPQEAAWSPCESVEEGAATGFDCFATISSIQIFRKPK